LVARYSYAPIWVSVGILRRFFLRPTQTRSPATL
jgi:hypothetical protein